MTEMGNENIKILEQTRQRLSQLTNSLASLQSVLQSNPQLPPWTSLQSHAAIISQNLTTLSTHLSTHSALFDSLAIFPLPTYPGKTQEPLLGQILRKKLEPDVEDWVAVGREIGCKLSPGGPGGEYARKVELLELWNWAGRAANELARRHEWGGDFTLEEREGGVENVVTGLRRKLGEEEDDDDDDDYENEDSGGDVKMADSALNREEFWDTDMEGKEGIKEAGNPWPLEQVLRFMMTGGAAEGLIPPP